MKSTTIRLRKIRMSSTGCSRERYRRTSKSVCGRANGVRSLSGFQRVDRIPALLMQENWKSAWMKMRRAESDIAPLPVVEDVFIAFSRAEDDPFSERSISISGVFQIVHLQGDPDIDEDDGPIAI